MRFSIVNHHRQIVLHGKMCLIGKDFALNRIRGEIAKEIQANLPNCHHFLLPGKTLDQFCIKIGGIVRVDPFLPVIADFYLTNPIARASKVMAECSALARSGHSIAAE